VFGADGSLYGATFNGGLGSGVVFKLTPPVSGSGAWTESVLYAFTGGNDGGFPHSSVAFDAAGALYGTTMSGGASGSGVVYRLTPPRSGGGAWTQSVLYSFTGGNDGGDPLAGVIIDPPGVLYGTAYSGGTVGYGVVYSLTPPTTPAGKWTQAVLHSFTGVSRQNLKGGVRSGVVYDGSSPHDGVIFDTAGGLYGAAQYGAAAGFGSVYKLQAIARPSGCTFTPPPAK
jgi:uncharacterized repeat protein (TIGR03803 family)